MSNRLDKDRQKKLEPIRKTKAIEELNKMDIQIENEYLTSIEFLHKGSLVKFFPYSGWHTGKTIKDGRGLKNLLKQL